MLVCEHCRKVYMQYEMIRDVSSAIVKMDMKVIKEDGKIIIDQGDEELIEYEGVNEESAVCPSCDDHVYTFYRWQIFDTEDKDIIELMTYFMGLVDGNGCVDLETLEADQLIKFKTLIDLLDEQ